MKKNVQIHRNLWDPLIKNSEKPKVQSIIHTDDRRDSEKPKTDVTKLYQKPKLISLSDEYDYKEEESDADDSYNNNQKTLVAPLIKKLPLVENKKKAPALDSEEDELPQKENELFICKLPKVSELLDDSKFDQRKKICSCNTMNYWCRKAIKYRTEEDTYLSTDAKKVLEKGEPDKKNKNNLRNI
jgi:hypothetical protein